MDAGGEAGRTGCRPGFGPSHDCLTVDAAARVLLSGFNCHELMDRQNNIPLSTTVGTSKSGMIVVP
jgi:hypothetical protein